MQKAVIDTRATASLLRKNISSLDTHMSVVKSNIEDFNKYVKVNYEGLKARGERCDDLMINLFKGYECASDREFVRYMKTKKDAYNDGADLEPEQLMTLALNKYEDLVKDGQWNAKSAEQEQIVALTAKLDKLQDTNLKLAKTLRSGGQSRGSGSSNSSNKSDKDSESKKSSKKDRWAWKKTPPKGGESHTKIVKIKGKDKEYHWCDEHPAWVRHRPEDCELKQQRATEQDERGSNSNKSQRKSYQSALQSIVADLEQEE
jgi:hypothetical protein